MTGIVILYKWLAFIENKFSSCKNGGYCLCILSITYTLASPHQIPFQTEVDPQNKEWIQMQFLFLRISKDL